MKRKYLLPVLVTYAVFNAFLSQTTFALDVEKSNPHDLSLDQSHQIALQNQLIAAAWVAVPLVILAILIGVFLANKVKSKRPRKK